MNSTRMFILVAPPLVALSAAYSQPLLATNEVLQMNRKAPARRQLFAKKDRVAWVADAPGSGCTHEYKR